jgi:hypothetical protein
VEQLKSKADLCKPDERHASFPCFDRSINDWRQRTIDDHYAAISQIQLADEVPELIQRSFATARNLLLYAWFEYPFVVVAELHAIACLEFALRWRINPKEGGPKAGLRHHMEYAIAQGWWRDEGVLQAAAASVGAVDLLESIGIAKRSPEDARDPQSYVKVLAQALPGLRNELAHGSALLYPGGYATLGVVAKLINQLWTPAGA